MKPQESRTERPGAPCMRVGPGPLWPKAVVLGVVASLDASGAAAQEICRSRAGPVPLGAVVCLEIPCVGRRMARCDRVLNNTSWTFLDQPCPVASRQPPAAPLAKLVAAN